MIEETDNNSHLTRWLAQVAISFLVIAVIIGFMVSYFVRAKDAAIDAKKKIELASLLTNIEFYYAVEGSAPENNSGEKYCEISKLYNNKKCLRELARDGYGSPPISPNDKPYLYYEDKEKFYVATQMSKELSEKSRCPHDKDPPPLVQNRRKVKHPHA